MNILFIPRWYPNKYDQQFGVFILKHARAAASFANVAVLYPCAANDLQSTFETEISFDKNLCTIIVYFQKGSRVRNAYRYWKAFRIGLKIVLRNLGKPGLIHAHVLLRPFAAAWYLGRKWNIPFLITEHWTGYLFDAFDNKPGIYKFLCRYFVKKAAALTLVSESLMSALEKKRIRNKSTLVLPNVVEIPEAGNSERKPGPLRILTVADLVDRNKNISATLSVLQGLMDKLPAFEYHIIGGGQDEEKLRNLASGLLPEHTVCFHGRQPNDYVLDFLRSVDFVIINSNIETFSVFTAEAIAGGIPVIATRCGGPEYFVHPHNGILIEKNNPQQLSGAIEKMSSTFHAYDKVAMREEMKKKFSDEAIGRQLAEIYASALKIKKN